MCFFGFQMRVPCSSERQFKPITVKEGESINMKKMKKLAAFSLILAMLLAAGCNSATKESSTQKASDAQKDSSVQASSTTSTESSAESSSEEPKPSVTYSKAEATAHIYEKDKTEKLTILKHPDLPGTAWINVMDFLKYDHNDKVKFEISKSGDVFTITKKNNGVTMDEVNTTMVIDTAKDTVTFDKQEMFIIGEDAFKTASSTINNPYVLELQPEYAEGSAVNSAVYDLSKYHFDAVAEGDDVYLPIPVISDIFGFNYNTAEFVDGEVYFVHAGDEVGADNTNPYVNKTSIYNNLTRDQKEIEFAYNELCFALDEIYGYPPNNNLSETMKELGFDKTVEQNEDLSHIKKEYLMSENLIEYYSGLSFVSSFINDGGHTMLTLMANILYVPTYAETELVKQLSNPERKIRFPEDAAKYTASMQNDLQWKQTLMATRNEAYTNNPNTVKENTTMSYLECGDKAVFAFDKFTYQIIPELMEALDHAASKGIKDFYFDLTCNTGGDERVAAYLMSLVNGDNSFSYLNKKTGNKIVQKVKVDKNLDGVFDEKDDAVKYDFNYKIITTQMSFSSANLFACLAQKAGIPIYGQRSGGGTCFVYMLNHTDTMAYMLSASNCFVIPADWSLIDSGAPVTEEWVKTAEDGSFDFSNLYNLIKTPE